MGTCTTEIELSGAELPGGDIGFQMGKKLKSEGNVTRLRERGETYNVKTLVDESKESSSDSESDMRLVLTKKRVNFLPVCEVIPLEIERNLLPSPPDRFPISNNMENSKIEACNEELPHGDILSRREKKLLLKKKRNGSSGDETCCVQVPFAETREDSSSLDMDFISTTKKVTFLPSCEIIPLEGEDGDTRVSDRLPNSSSVEVCEIKIEKWNAELADGDIGLQIERELLINKGIIRSLENKNETYREGAPIAEISEDTSGSENDIDFILTEKRVNFLYPFETIPESGINFMQSSSSEQPNSDNPEVCETKINAINAELPHGDILSQKEKKLLDINKERVRSPKKESKAYDLEVPIAEINQRSSDSESNIEFILTKKRVKFHPSCEIIPLESENNAIQISSDRQPNSANMEDCEIEFEVLNTKSPRNNCRIQMEKQPVIKTEANLGSPKKDSKHVMWPGVETHDDSSDLENDMDFIFTKKKKKKKVKFIPSNENIPVYCEISVAQSSFKTLQISDKYSVDTKNDYTYDYLLTRVFNKMRERNPNLDEEVKKKLIMKPPQVIRAGAKKTSFANFLDICKLLHRTPQHLQSFLLSELGTNGSVDGNSQLVIKGKFLQKQIENVLRRYIREYVTCHTCHSPDTLLQRDTRLCFLQCEACGSRCSVASIKSGFQAVINKRAAIRAKAV